ncbi:MAG: hypothetical protein M1826_003920 [Phylliscum demangeonii]|nr:MAG: hypothetical protein M1826_003920 [Phylliscum demangeonii]
MSQPMRAGHGSRGRVSVFKEIGLALDGLDDCFGNQRPPSSPTIAIPATRPSTASSQSSCDGSPVPDHPPRRKRTRRWFSRTRGYIASIRSLAKAVRLPPPPRVPPSTLSTLTHFAILLVLFVLVLPGVQLSISFGATSYGCGGVAARSVRARTSETEADPGVQKARLEARADSPTAACLRWSHQSAVVNGTLYLYGGQARQDELQTTDTWNNNLLTLPLSSTFQIGSPTLKGLPQPLGPPPVANGYLWNSLTSLYLYGGLFSDKPATSPVPLSLWEYDIRAASWKEHASPHTSAGDKSEPAGVPVQRAAEGAGLSVPELGRGWYFGGHLDGYTTPGWSQSIPRLYLKSFIEYTFPGAVNDGVQGMAGGNHAGSDGAWRNITHGGLQDLAGFTDRADGVLLYVPGFGPQGILIGLAGGTNTSFTQMNVIDVYDIATSNWYKQATSGETPKIRVNPCAVVAAAADGSSYNVHLYGGQNLIPYGQQTQYDDIWILTIPSFRWIPVNTTGQSNPPARAGHSCNVWDGQMVVVGGYVGQQLTCDSPGVYVFDLSTLKWQTQFTALSGSNAQDQQPSQQQKSSGAGDLSRVGLSGSYGYRVPAAVQAVIGGHESGGATVTAPEQTATSGPIATGKPATFTVTQAAGVVVTQTGPPEATSTLPPPPTTPSTGPSASSSSNSSSNKNSAPNVAAIVAGVIAGVFALAAAYFAFCAWVYRKQLTLYKNHVAMSQRATMTGAGIGVEKSGLGAAFPPQSSAGSSSRPTHFSSAANASSTGGLRASSARSSTDDLDLMAGQEPSFLGVLLSPRRSLRVINRD